jgi:hypothetical protein
MVSLGYQVPPNMTHKEVFVCYLNLLHRAVKAQPRRVHRATKFSCPPGFEAGLAIVEGKILRGDSLRAHLSRSLLNSSYQDSMLNDWDVHHLHLGTALEADGFVSRTAPLLFARFDDENAYLIDIRPHGSWTDFDLLQAVHANWPQTLERFRIRGVHELASVPLNGVAANDQARHLRKGGLNAIMELGPGAFYAAIGGGYATDGTSTIVMRRCLELMRLLQDLEEQTVPLEIDLRENARRNGNGDMPEPLRVELFWRSNGDFVASCGGVLEWTCGTLTRI